MKTETKYALLLILAAALWGSSFVASKLCINSGLFPFEIVFYRFFFGTIVMWFLFRRHLGGMRAPTVRAGVLLGVVTAAGFVLEICGLSVTAASKTSFLTATNIVILPLLYCLCYRIRPHGWSLLAAGVAMAGVGAMCLGGGFGGFAVGDLVLLLAAVMYAVGALMVSAIDPACPRIQITFLQFVTMAAVLGILTLVQGRSGHYPPIAIAAVVFQVLFPTVLCYLIRNFAMQFVNPVKSTLILALESVFCTLLSALLLRERITLRMLCGIALIGAAIVLETLHPITKPPTRAQRPASHALTAPNK
ncbi:MAG: DMT family transporter [Oscillospiraceae bacterium]|nr:DMT family transporter [Oscillospiraceae bacterium]